MRTQYMTRFGKSVVKKTSDPPLPLGSLSLSLSLLSLFKFIFPSYTPSFSMQFKRARFLAFYHTRSIRTMHKLEKEAVNVSFNLTSSWLKPNPPVLESMSLKKYGPKALAHVFVSTHLYLLPLYFFHSLSRLLRCWVNPFVDGILCRLQITDFGNAFRKWHGFCQEDVTLFQTAVSAGTTYFLELKGEAV